MSDDGDGGDGDDGGDADDDDGDDDGDEDVGDDDGGDGDDGFYKHVDDGDYSHGDDDGHGDYEDDGHGDDVHDADDHDGGDYDDGDGDDHGHGVPPRSSHALLSTLSNQFRNCGRLKKTTTTQQTRPRLRQKETTNIRNCGNDLQPWQQPATATTTRNCGLTPDRETQGLLVSKGM